MVDEGVIDEEDRELFWFAETAQELEWHLLHWHDASGEVLARFVKVDHRTVKEPALKLSFHGADRSVTGSCHMVECAGKRILIDWAGRTKVGAS